MGDTKEELQKQIDEYEEQKKQIEGLLKLEPNNKELQQYLDDAQQLIDTTKEVLALKQLEEREKEKETKPEPVKETPKKVKFKYEAGLVCKAKWTVDQQWYDAIIERIDQSTGKYCVLFTGYGNRDIVPEDHIDAPAPKLKAEQDLTPIEIPTSLRISKDDSAEVKAVKKKKIHSIKSKNRFKQMDAMTNTKQNSWQQFMKTTTNKKRGHPFLKKESMFRTPDSVEGKVGVVGSGKGMTQYDDTRKVDTRRKKVTLSLDHPERK